MDVFNQGAPVTLTTTVTNAANVAEDPANLVLVYRNPLGVETTKAFADLTNEAGAGVWSYTIPASESLPGVWTWDFTSTTPSGADSGSFMVRASAIRGGQVGGTGPCSPWCSPDELTDGGWTIPTGVTRQMLEQACTAASEVLYELGGRRWPGLCWDSIVPSTCYGGAMFVLLPDGSGGLRSYSGVTVGLGGVTVWPHPHGCWGADVVDLGTAQVTAIDAVRVDGTALATTAYRLIDRRWLARIDGSTWPCCSDPTDTTPSLEIDLTFGESPPAAAAMFAVALARDLARGLSSSDDCAIDPRVISLVREGVSLSLQDGGTDPDTYVEIPAVRRFLNVYNPHRIGRAASVIVPGQQVVHSRY